MENYILEDGKKFMWDGEEYPSESAARDTIKKYAEEGFETKLVLVDGKTFVYSRRVAAEIVVEGGSA